MNIEASILMQKLAEKGIIITFPPEVPFINDEIAIEAPCSIAATIALYQSFKIGAYSHLNGGFIKDVSIGRYCSFARDVQIGHGFHPDNWLSVNPIQYSSNYRNWRGFAGKLDNDFPFKEFQWAKHTNIGNDVWIGNHVIIKDGVTIGDGAIIGAGSIVTKDVAPYSIVAGNPAKLIRMRFSDKIIERLINLKWWEYDIFDFENVDFTNIELAVSKIEELLYLGKLSKLNPVIFKSEHIRNTLLTNTFEE